MPRSFDTARLKVTHHPNQRLDTAPQRLKKPAATNTSAMWTQLLDNLGLQYRQNPQASQSFVESVIKPFIALLNPLFGIEEQENLITIGDFEGSAAIKDAGQPWSHDSAVGRTSEGSAKASANGTVIALQSNEVAVTEGQLLNVSVWLKWSSVTAAAGIAFKLDIAEYSGPDGDTFVGYATVDSVSSPSVNQPFWQQLTEIYSAPAGVTRIRVRLAVESSVTAGTVWFDDASLTKTTLLQQQANDSSDNMQETWDRLFNAFMGLFGAGRTVDNLANAATSQADAVAGNAAAIARIMADLGPGNSDSDEFERSGPVLGSDWDSYSTGSGTTITDGHNAVMAATALGGGYEVVHRHNTVVAAGLTGEYQRTEMVFDSVPESFVINGHNDLWLRMTTFSSWATRTGMRLRYSANGAWSLDWFNLGTATNLASGNMMHVLDPGYLGKQASAGGRIAFEAGYGGTPRRFRGTLNDTPFMDESELGTTSQYGASYRYRGFGGESEALVIIADPGKLRQWTANG